MAAVVLMCLTSEVSDLAMSLEVTVPPVSLEMEEGSVQFFRDGPAQRGPLTTALLAEKKPGDIFALGLQAVREKLAATHGDSVLTDHSRRILSFYCDQVLKPSLPHNIPVHTERELRTIAVGFDKLIEGNVVSCGDVFMGRFKAHEESLLSDGGWEVARKHEVVSQRQVGITSEEERQRVMALQVREVQLKTALSNLRGCNKKDG